MKSATKAQKYVSTTHYVLSSLLPYTDANLKLAFRPNQFFNDLEKIDKQKRKSSTIRMGYYRAVKQGLVYVDDAGLPILTERGLRKLERYEPRQLRGDASVLVIFDIPEESRHLRDRLRRLLRELRFEPVQQSVWRSDYDVVGYVVEGIREEGLAGYVEVYECARID